MDTLEAIRESLVKGQAPKVSELVQTALDEGIKVEKILSEGLIAPMGVVGEQFRKEEIYLPEVLFVARAMQAGMVVLEPLLVSAGVEPVGKIALGTVKGDIHNIGKNLVGIMFKGAGFEVIDLGIDAPTETFVDAARKGVPLIGMSALTSTTMLAMRAVIEALETAGLKDRVKTMVGGAIVTQTYADRIGADVYCADAVAAVEKARALISTQPH